MQNRLCWKEHKILKKQVLGFKKLKITEKNKVGLLVSEKNYTIWFIESALKMTKNAFCFIIKACFVLKIFAFLSWLFGHVEKTAWLERSGYF